MPLYLRGDSGFASPDLYNACEENDCKYAIRLKQNKTLMKYVAEADDALYRATRRNQIDYAVEYGEFEYQAGSWSHPRRCVFKIEKPYNQIIHLYIFVVTTMETEPHQVIQFYCGRGKMKNFIKEGKSGFDFSSVSSHSRGGQCKPPAGTCSCLQPVQLVPAPGIIRKHENTADRHYSFEAAEGRCESGTFSKVYYIQTVQQLSV